MKLILATLIALSTTSAFAGSEVVYLKPFKKQTEVFKHDNVSSLEIWNARIADVPTTVERDYSRCQFEDSFACPKTTVLETTKAVQVDISYFTSHDDGGVQEQLFLDPKELSSATIALLQGKKALGG
ncbi:MAG: hypothetical protein V4692_16860, partial [Bdellovibrionota bacterium]